VARAFGLPPEARNQRVEELVDVLLADSVYAFAVIGSGARGVLGDGVEIDEAAQVGLEERGAEVEAAGELAAARGTVEDQGSENGDSDSVAEDVDGSFDV
jgi:hypothetical protein